MLRIETLSGGYKNVTLQVVGLIDSDMPMTEIVCAAKPLRLESVVWVVQEKMGVELYWDQDHPLWIMESRNSMRFDVGIPSPKDWGGSMWIRTVGFDNPITETKQFFVVLDFDK